MNVSGPEPPGVRPIVLLAVILAASAAYLLVWSGRSDPAPLPWDCSHHYLGALEVGAAIRSGAVLQLGEALLAEDQYPPGHSLLLGAWLAAFGEGRASLILFHLSGLWLCIGGLVVIAWSLPGRRREPFLLAGSAFLLATIPVLVLAGTFMVEVPAAGLLLIAIGTLARLAGSGRPGHLLASWSAGSAVLLTKHNVGLPWLAAGAMLALCLCLPRAGGGARSGRRRALLVLVAVAGAGATWAAFLSLQHNGWGAFLQFTENRASPGDLSSLDRIWWYLRLYAGEFHLHPLAGVLVALLAALALRERLPVVPIAAGYVLTSLAALARHEYLLDRNLFAPAVALVVLAAVGLSGTPAAGRLAAPRWGGWLRASLIVGAIALVVAGTGRARSSGQRYLPPGRGGAATLSSFLEPWLSEGRSIRVVGTFGWLSAGWVHILRERAFGAGDSGLSLDFPYPGPPSRFRHGELADEVCARAVDDWLAGSPEELVATIEVDDSSPLYDLDYHRWSAWKRQYARCLAGKLRGRTLAVLSLPAEGIRAHVFDARPEPVVFGPGWGAGEEWGRWAMLQEAEVRVPAGATLDLEYAAFPGMETPQQVRIRCGGALIDEFVVAGAPWGWQRRSIPVPASPGVDRATLRFEFAGRFHGDPDDPLWRTLPVRSLTVREGATPGAAGEPDRAL